MHIAEVEDPLVLSTFSTTFSNYNESALKDVSLNY